MFKGLLKKDFKLFFKNKKILLVSLILPLLVIIVFGFTLDGYMKGNYNTFKDGKVLYYVVDDTNLEEFNNVSNKIKSATGVEFELTDNYDEGIKKVNKSEAFGIIKIKDNTYDYYRSTYNETEGGKIVRTLFLEMINNSEANNQDILINDVVLDIKKMNAKPYYTFAGLSFALLITSYFYTVLFYKEKALKTNDRIILSNSKALLLSILSKITVGFIMGICQIFISLLVASIIFKIEWNKYFAWIILVFLVEALFSSSIASLAGCICKEAVGAQTMSSLIAMLSAYLGGSITPIYLLERTFIKYLVKISPIYWTNKSITALYNQILDKNTVICLAVILSISLLFIALSIFITNSRYKKVVKFKEVRA